MLRGVHRWGLGYLRQRLRVMGAARPRHLVFCVADHFEPFCRTVLPDGSVTGGMDPETAMRRVMDWCRAYKHTVADVRDDDGRRPRHTFFYPWDEYDPKVVDLIGMFCAQGFGEVEVHLHHRADTPEKLRMRLQACCSTYASEHGLLGRHQGNAGFVFVHGNWALCNSRPDGDWCGVAAELAVLRESGCYMDCTFPSAPSATQPAFVNQIYYGGDPKSGYCGHRLLAPVRVGEDALPDGLLMVQGPLGFNWNERRRGGLPRLENGEITQGHPLTKARLRHWRGLHIHVEGKAEWAFVKLHTHGLDAASQEGMTGASARLFHAQMPSWCHELGMQLHYVSARELYNIIKAAEAGKTGSPGDWRDYVYAPPPVLAR
jgi:hypothetical protein